jgi:hypothetical protein
MDLPAEAKKLGLEPGAVYPILNAVYGLMDSPRLFTEAFKESAKKLKWTEVAECILACIDKEAEAPRGLMFMHMDDLMNMSEKPEEMLKDVDKSFKLGSIELMSTKPTAYTGLDIAWDTKAGNCEVGQKTYIDNIKTELNEKEKRKKFGPADLKLNEPTGVDLAYEKAQQAWNGVLGWAAKTQPDLSLTFAELSRNCTKPSERSVLSTRRACEYAKQICKPLEFEGVTKPALVMWVDASFDIRKCDGRIGWEAQVVESSLLGTLPDGKVVSKLPTTNLIGWRTKRCERKLISTTSAELMAMVEGVKIAPGFIKLIEKLWGTKPRIVFITDSQPLLGWMRTGWVKTDPAVQGSLDFVNERIKDMGADVIWVDTKHQRADRQTKFVAC